MYQLYCVRTGCIEHGFIFFLSEVMNFLSPFRNLVVDLPYPCDNPPTQVASYDFITLHKHSMR